MSTNLDTAKGTPQGPPDGTQGSLVSLLSKLDIDTKTLSVHNIERDESDAENNACNDLSTGRPIRYSHIPHNTPCLPPKTLHNLCFIYLLVITVVPREIKDNACATFWGANKVYYGKCENG